jgi:hypothetical protein
VSSIHYNLGRHLVCFEEELLVVRLIGPYLPEAATQLLQLVDQQFHEFGRVFLLVDVTQSELPGPETRRVVASWPLLGRYVVVLFGLGMLARGATQLILSAQRALGSTPGPDIHYCSSEPEARALLHKLRGPSGQGADAAVP